MKALRILVADDYPTIRYGLRAILEAQAGWKVVAEAEDGEEALALAREEKPDLAILDLQMPKLGGLETMRRLRQLQPGVKILLMGMEADPEKTREVMAAGADGIIFKSDTGRLHCAAVEAVAESRRFFHGVGGLADPEGEKPKRAKETLTRREGEVVRLVAQGLTSKEVAQRLGISPKTVDVHRMNLMSRLDLHSTAEMVRYAIRHGLADA